MLILINSLYIQAQHPQFMAGIDDRFKSAYDTIHDEVTELNKSAAIKDWGTAFEKWCVPKLSQWFQIPEQDAVWVGEKGNERMLDIGMIDRTHGIIYIVQCKSSVTKDHSKASPQPYKMVGETDGALKWLKKVPDDGNAARKKFARDVCEFLGCDLKALKDQSDEKFRRLFVTNSVVTENKQVKEMVKDGLEIWDVEKLYNNCFKQKRELSNEIDVYHYSNAKEGEKITSRFGYVKVKDLVNFSQITKVSDQIDDTLFEDNLRHQLHDKEAQAIRNDILRSLLENPSDFPSLNNGLLVVGARTKKHSDGWILNPNGTLAWEGSDKANRFAQLSAKKSKSSDEDKELKILQDEYETIQEEITSIQISHPGIINGGQTTTALYDHIVDQVMPEDEKGDELKPTIDDLSAAKEAFVFCKFCFIDEDDEISRQKLAIASNRQNPIEAIDYLSYRDEHIRIFEKLDALDHSILYMYKRGLDNLASDTAKWKERVSSNLDARYMRKIPIDTFALNLLAAREGKPGKAREGAETAKILVVGSENYEAVFKAPSDFDIKIVVFGEFLRRVTELQRRTRNHLIKIQKKQDETVVGAESDEDEKEKLRQKHSITIAQNIGFTNYWTYSLMYLFHKIFTQIADNYFSKKKDTIFEDCKNKTECVELLYDLAIHGENTDFLKNEDIVSLCFHKNASKTYFSDDLKPDSTDSKNKIQVYFEKGDKLTLLTGTSETHPILFKTMHSIYDSLRTKYDAAKSGNYFNDQKNIDNVWNTSLEPRCNEVTPILNTFGIQVSTKETVATGTAAGTITSPFDQLMKMIELYDAEDSFEDFVEELVEENHHFQIDIGELSKVKWKKIHRILRNAEIKDLPEKAEFHKSLVKKVKELVEDDTEATPELGAADEPKKK